MKKNVSSPFSKSSNTYISGFNTSVRESDFVHAELLKKFSMITFLITFGAILYSYLTKNINHLELALGMLFMGCIFLYGAYYSLYSYYFIKVNELEQYIEKQNKEIDKLYKINKDI